MFRLPGGSSKSDEELEEEIPGFRRRAAIIERRYLDFEPLLTFLLIRPGIKGPVPKALEAVPSWRNTDIEDTLVKCFWCREDGWLGIGQVQAPRTRTTCLCCQATMMALGVLPADERNRVYLRADPDVPRRS